MGTEKPGPPKAYDKKYNGGRIDGLWDISGRVIVHKMRQAAEVLNTVRKPPKSAIYGPAALTPRNRNPLTIVAV